ncbi:hypothetical protein QDZ26_001872 [Pluralibacter gergoviae]|nr:hypothetical protein [Pluralibacter gergoviae]
MSDFIYNSDEYGRQSQRFVLPLYIKDDIGDYNYSSTGTLLNYNQSRYIVFAAHALEGGVDINNVCTLGTNGEFINLVDIAIGYRVFEEDDLVIIDCFNVEIEGKNYFLLQDKFSFIGFDRNHFSWTGFPQSWCKAKVIHRTKKPDAIARENVIDHENGLYFKNAKYFTITSRVNSFNKIEITGHYEIKNADLMYKGKVSKGPSPQGMSGGAMYFFSKGQVLKDDIQATFLFAGIGLSFKKDGSISGISRYRVIELLNQFDDESPLFIKINH